MNSCSSLPRILCAQTIQPMMNDMSLHPYPKGAPTGCQISIPPFDMTSHPLTSLPGTDTNRISAEKCSRSLPFSKQPFRNKRLTQNPSKWNEKCKNVKCRNKRSRQNNMCKSLGQISPLFTAVVDECHAKETGRKSPSPNRKSNSSWK